MPGMTQRERFLNTLLGEKTDRFPFFDLEPGKETLRRWQREGLPRRVSVAAHFNRSAAVLSQGMKRLEQRMAENDPLAGTLSTLEKNLISARKQRSPGQPASEQAARFASPEPVPP